MGWVFEKGYKQLTHVKRVLWGTNVKIHKTYRSVIVHVEMSEDPSGIFTYVQQGQAGKKKKYPGRKTNWEYIRSGPFFFRSRSRRKMKVAINAPETPFQSIPHLRHLFFSLLKQPQG
jgi:hypothetical protein